MAAALSLGLMNSSPTPVMREMPLSKSDIVIAQDTSGQGSAKMGESSGTKSGSSNENSDKSDSEKMSQPAPK
jgi:hypothetical protein